MLQLDATNAVEYLRQVGLLRRDEPAAAVSLGWGVSNSVVRINAVDRSIVLKQSRAQLRTRESWFSNLDRVFREAAVMQALATRLTGGVIPRVLFEDRDNFAFAMEAAPPEFTVWKQLLLDGEVDLQ